VSEEVDRVLGIERRHYAFQINHLPTAMILSVIAV
jgi:hypothetical protein